MGPWWGGSEGFKRLLRKAPQLQAHRLLSLDTSVTMWFLVLRLALSLAGTGETVGKMWEGAVGPDSNAALDPTS